MTLAKFCPTLLRTLLYGPLRASVAVAILSTPLAVSQRDVFTCHDPFPLVLLVLLAIAFGASLAGNAHRYVMTRGFSSACLWAHAALAGILVLGVATIPPALAIWTGFRSRTQSFGNPLFPLMQPVEYPVPLFWFAAGALLMTTAMFGAIRAAQPGGTRSAGLFIFLAVAASLFVISGGYPRLTSWELCLVAATLIAIGLALLFGSRKLHRSMEVL